MQMRLKKLNAHIPSVCRLQKRERWGPCRERKGGRVYNNNHSFEKKESQGNTRARAYLRFGNHMICAPSLPKKNPCGDTADWISSRFATIGSPLKVSHWPGKDVIQLDTKPSQVAATNLKVADRMEPEGPFYTTRCKQKRERRAKGGLHIFTMASQPRVIERKGFSISLSQK